MGQYYYVVIFTETKIYINNGFEIKVKPNRYEVKNILNMEKEKEVPMKLTTIIQYLVKMLLM
jgi:hypothetical protein